MPYNPQIHHRRSIRLKGYDYSQEGLYFLTLCCKDRACLFGEIANGEMVLNEAGTIAKKCWLEIPHHFKNVVLHPFIVMPNHVHGIVEFVGAKNLSPLQGRDYEDTVVGNLSPLQSGDSDQEKDDIVKDLSLLQGGDQEKDNRAKNLSPLQPTQPPLFGGTSKTIGSVVRGFKIGVTKWMREHTAIYDVWQRNYYEHIIKNEQSYQKIADYIEDNPRRWYEDKLYKE